MEVTPEDRKFIERLQAAIADPATTPEQREELREELGDIFHSYVVANMLEEDTDNAEEDAGCSHAESAVPSYDQTMSLLATIMDTYSWSTFKTILYDPEKLTAWLIEKMEPEQSRQLDPEDPAAVELSQLTAETEHAGMMFWRELNPAEHEMMKMAFLALWGGEGAAMLPVSLR